MPRASAFTLTWEFLPRTNYLATNPEKGAGYGHDEAPGTASFWSDSGDLVQLTRMR